MYNIETYKITDEEPADLDYYNSLPTVCSYCQRSYTLANPQTLDHIKPLSILGKSRCKSIGFSMISNLVLSCKECNELKGSLTLKEFKLALTDPFSLNKNVRGKYIRTARFIIIPVRRRLTMISSIGVLLDFN